MTAGYRVEGRVQGVGFRNWVRRRAEELGLVGWVRNLPDGAVEVQACGEPHAMRALREALGRGPVMARVDGVSEVPVADDRPEHGFAIRR